MWQYFFAALGLMLVFEGIMPFLSPEKWRKMANYLSCQSDKYLRIMGLILMLVGLGILIIIHSLFNII